MAIINMTPHKEGEMARYTINGKRYDTNKMIDLGIRTQQNYGVSIEGVYLTKTSKRVFVETYSIWESGRNDGTVEGGGLHEADEYEISRLANRHDCQVLYDLLDDDSD